MSLIERLSHIRFTSPDSIADALARRTPSVSRNGEPLLVVAADHSARGALVAGDNDMAMASREELLARCCTALSRPGVNGFLGTADMVEDLALLGMLEGKTVFGSMNRSGLSGSVFEVDDRMTAWDTDGIVAANLDGGKMLLRMDPAESATSAMLERAAGAVNELAQAQKIALIEPFMSGRRGGIFFNDLAPESVMRSMAIASGLGRTSARTWLKLPCVAEMERVMTATTLPCLLLGGEVSEDLDASVAHWAAALQLPNVKGLVIGRALLFPRGDDVAAAVDQLVEVL
ncbi:Cgl0159 family (beta/alpha)8-fold protein [Tessaracoccus sp.]